MARPISEIYQNLLNVKETKTELNDLNSTSNTALFKVFLYVFAIGVNLLEQYQDLAREEFEYIRETTPTNTKKWWNHILLNDYQYSTENDKGVLKLDKEIPYYTTISEESKIIKFCSITQSENSRQINIKVTKSDPETGLPLQLKTAELLSVEQFVDRKKPACAFTNIVSLPADESKIECSVFFDGGYVREEVENNILNALESFFINLSKNNFEGEVSKTKLIDTVQNVDGVLDVDSSNFKLFCRANAELNYTDVQVFYKTLAGYIFLDKDQTIIKLDIK